MRAVIASSLAMFLSVAAWAQAPSLSDQLPPRFTTIDSTKPDAVFGKWTNWTKGEKKVLRPKSKFKSFEGLDPNNGKTPSEKDLYVVHIVESKEVITSPPDVTVSTIDIYGSNWFLYRYSNKDGLFHQILKKDKTKPDSNDDDDDADLYEAPSGTIPPLYDFNNGYLISISRLALSPIRTLPQISTGPAAPTLAYTITSSETVAGNVSSLQALLAAVTNVTPAPPVRAPAPGEILGFNYSVQVARLNGKSLKAPFSIAFSAVPSGKVDGTGDCHNVTSKTTCTLAQTIPVLDHEWWNVGVNIPVWGPVEYKYDLAKDGSVEQSKTRHSALVATFDFSPWAYKCSMTKCPYLQVGVPLSGAAFHAPYFGVAQPIPLSSKWLQISVYGGVVLMRQSFPKTYKIGDVPATAADFNSDLQTNWPVKVLYGFEVPISSIVKSIKSSIGGGK